MICVAARLKDQEKCGSRSHLVTVLVMNRKIQLCRDHGAELKQAGAIWIRRAGELVKVYRRRGR